MTHPIKYPIKRTYVKTLRNHAIFPPCEPDETCGATLLQNFLHDHHPSCFVKQKRTCIKFKHSASATHTIANTPDTQLYNRLADVKTHVEKITTFLASHDHMFSPLEPTDIHFLDGIPVLVAPHKIVATYDIPTHPASYLANLLRKLLDSHTQTLPPLCPVQRFITEHVRIEL